MRTARILIGDVRARLAELPEASVQCCCTSPPYWGLRDYGVEPSVWGGDPSCEHVWGASVRAPWADNISGPNGVKKNTAKNWTKESGAFCQQCGAWFGALGLEPTPDLFVAHLVDVFGHVHRVLKDDGVLWMNLGDCYAGAGAVGNAPGGGVQGERWKGASTRGYRGDRLVNTNSGTIARPKTEGDRNGHEGKHGYRVGPMTQPNRMPIPGLKAKDLVGVPWMAAFALRAAGWWLRSDVIWSKPNPMPESIKDRPTKAHEYIFLLTKSERYFYDADAIKEPYAESTLREIAEGYEGQGLKDYAGAGVQNPSDTKRRIIESAQKNQQRRRDKANLNDWDKRERKGAQSSGPLPLHSIGKQEGRHEPVFDPGGRNRRTVWTVPTQPYAEAHFATFPEALIEPCILAGSRVGDTVLDPFTGSGTTGVVACRHDRHFIGTELNPTYAALAERRIRNDAVLFNSVEVSA